MPDSNTPTIGDRIDALKAELTSLGIISQAGADRQFSDRSEKSPEPEPEAKTFAEKSEPAPEGPPSDGSLGDEIRRYLRALDEIELGTPTDDEIEVRTTAADAILTGLDGLPVVTGGDAAFALDLLDFERTGANIPKELCARLFRETRRWISHVYLGTEDDLDNLEALCHALNTAGLNLINEGYDVDGTTIARLANLARDHLQAITVAINGKPRH